MFMRRSLLQLLAFLTVASLATLVGLSAWMTSGDKVPSPAPAPAPPGFKTPEPPKEGGGETHVHGVPKDMMLTLCAVAALSFALLSLLIHCICVSLYGHREHLRFMQEKIHALTEDHESESVSNFGGSCAGSGANLGNLGEQACPNILGAPALSHGDHGNAPVAERSGGHPGPSPIAEECDFDVIAERDVVAEV